MCEVHLTAQVDVSAGVMGEFLSNYLTESGRMIPILGRISINGSVEWLCVPNFHITGGPFWSVNLLYTCFSWGDSVTTTNQNWVIQPGGPNGSVAAAWSRPVPVCLAYVRRRLEKMCAPTSRVRDNHLRSRRLSRMHSPSARRNLIRNPQVNRRDDHREGPFDQ